MVNHQLILVKHQLIFLSVAVLDYLLKLKRGIELAFGAHFLHDFSMKVFFT